MSVVYDSFLPAVRRLEDVGVEAREPSGYKGRLVWGYKTVPYGCQENKVLLKPIRGGPLSSWYWLLLAGYGQLISTFMRQWLNDETEWLGCTVRTFYHVERSNACKWSGCFHSSLADSWVGVHHDYICPQMVLVPWGSHMLAFGRNIGSVWRKAYVFRFNKMFTCIPLYKWNVSLYQHQNYGNFERLTGHSYTFFWEPVRQ